MRGCDQPLRAVQDRHRTFQFAHGRPHAGCAVVRAWRRAKAGALPHCRSACRWTCTARLPSPASGMERMQPCSPAYQEKHRTALHPQTLCRHRLHRLRTASLSLAGVHTCPVPNASAICSSTPHQMFPDAASPTHPNGVRFSAFSADEAVTLSQARRFFHRRRLHRDSGTLRARRPCNSRRQRAKSRIPSAARRSCSRSRTEHRLTIAELVLANERCHADGSRRFSGRRS